MKMGEWVGWHLLGDVVRVRMVPIIRGMRISVEQIVLDVAAGIAQGELLSEYPGLEPEDIQAALQYAADLVAAVRIRP